MKLIVGLGNPGERYRGTPHSVGFETIDVLAERLGISLRRSFRFNARLGRAEVDGNDLLLVQPQTFMNNSGYAVGAILRYHKLGASDLIVVVDDADLKLGRLRIRAKGSSGGHKGLASVAEATGGGHFTRVRLGIGRGSGGQELVTRVLSRFAGEERAVMDGTVKRAADAVLTILRDGLDKAMNEYNTVSKEGTEKEADVEKV